MCGIAGIIGKPRPKEIISILTELQIRGDDATGVSLNCPDVCRVFKAGVDADIFCKLPTLRKNLHKYCGSATVALLHTRFATCGTPLNNHNNHPIWNDEGVIIHNGIVFTKYYHPEAIGSTDTEQFLMSVTEKGLYKAIKECSGSLAIAFQRFKDRHVVYLYRYGSPLYLGRKNGNIYFCSEAKILRDAIGEFTRITMNWRKIYRIDAMDMSIEEVCEVTPTYGITYFKWGDYYYND